MIPIASTDTTYIPPSRSSNDKKPTACMTPKKVKRVDIELTQAGHVALTGPQEVTIATNIGGATYLINNCWISGVGSRIATNFGNSSAAHITVSLNDNEVT